MAPAVGVAAVPQADEVVTPAPATPVGAGRRRLELVQRRQVDSAPIRTVPGQLPVLGRAYLAAELRGIAVISTSLLAVIVALTFILR
jgi:hypothetical protein